MGYSDQKFYSRSLVLALPFATSLGTATGAGTASNSLAQTAAVTARATKFKRRSSITAIRMNPTTVTDAAATAVIAVFKNGTATFGTAVLTTNVAGTTIDGVITNAANAALAADTRVTIDVIGTFTASGSALGAFDVFFEVQERFLLADTELTSG